MALHKPEVLNLGAGGDTHAEQWNVDREALPGIDEVVDLDEYPWPWDRSSFMAVRTRHVLEHLREPLAAVSEIKRVLCSGGEWHLTYPIGHTRFEDPTHRHYWNWHTAAAIVGDRAHSHEFVGGFDLRDRGLDWHVPTRPWRYYTRARLRVSGPGPWLSQIPGLSGEVHAVYERQ